MLQFGEIRRSFRAFRRYEDPKTNLIQFAGDYIAGLRSSSEVSRMMRRARRLLDDYHSLLHFPFTSLELSSHPLSRSR